MDHNEHTLLINYVNSEGINSRSKVTLDLDILKRALIFWHPNCFLKLSEILRSYFESDPE